MVPTNSTTPNGKVSLIRLCNDLEVGFGKFRSEYKLKNYWYPRQRRLSWEAARERSSNKAAISYILNDVTDILPY